MFESAGFSKTLDESIFQNWLEKGRNSRISVQYLLIVWNEFEADYQAVYAENRDKIFEYKEHGMTNGTESLVAVYDVFSESRISLN